MLDHGTGGRGRRGLAQWQGQQQGQHNSEGQGSTAESKGEVLRRFLWSLFQAERLSQKQRGGLAAFYLGCSKLPGIGAVISMTMLSFEQGSVWASTAWRGLLMLSRV